jgi:hypothetical protein
MARLTHELLEDNPFTTLQVVLEPTGGLTPEAVQRELGLRLLSDSMAACQDNPTYLDKHYALHAGRPNGAKRFIVLLPLALRDYLPRNWAEDVGSIATIAWRAGPDDVPSEHELAPYECTWAGRLSGRPIDRQALPEDLLAT